VKGLISPLAYLLAIPVALVLPLAAFVIYIGVALLWFVPDMRIERQMPHEPHVDQHPHTGEPLER
jgi:hypothetical protein